MEENRSLDELLGTHASGFVRALHEAAARAGHEEHIRIATERQLGFLQREVEISLEGEHEFTVATGRIDSVYERVLIEYKNPNDASARIGETLTARGSLNLVEQIKSRFGAIQDKCGHTLNSLLGVGFDGRRFIFVRFHSGAWHIEEPANLTRYTAERFLWALFNLGTRGRPFTPERLARDFGSQSATARNDIKLIYTAICHAASPKATIFFQQWKIFFAEVCGHDVDRPSRSILELAELHALEPSALRPAEFLFSIHTYYALLMKLLAAEMLLFSTNCHRRFND
jgi:hypothetical protein